jgi:ADP-heptose:LPS heptosyltransferase
VAAAFGVPQVVIFGPSDWEVWSPWRTVAKILRAEGPIANIPVARAIAAVERLRMVAAE